MGLRAAPKVPLSPTVPDIVPSTRRTYPTWTQRKQELEAIQGMDGCSAWAGVEDPLMVAIGLAAQNG